MDRPTSSAGPGRPSARRAEPDDAPELTRLRAVMFAAMGQGDDESWRPACEDDLRLLLSGDAVAAFVVDAPDGSGLACGVVGTLDRRLPGCGRTRRHSVVGHVSSMATDPRWRRRGLARTALEALLDWFADRGAASVTLNATAEGEPLYRSLGFSRQTHPALRLALPRSPERRGSAAEGLRGELAARDPHA
jgi:GNAT superfamily N-acetyltransferase